MSNKTGNGVTKYNKKEINTVEIIKDKQARRDIKRLESYLLCRSVCPTCKRATLTCYYPAIYSTITKAKIKDEYFHCEICGTDYTVTQVISWEEKVAVVNPAKRSHRKKVVEEVKSIETSKDGE